MQSALVLRSFKNEDAAMTCQGNTERDKIHTYHRF